MDLFDLTRDFNFTRYFVDFQIFVLILLSFSFSGQLNPRLFPVNSYPKEPRLNTHHSKGLVTGLQFYSVVFVYLTASHYC